MRLFITLFYLSYALCLNSIKLISNHNRFINKILPIFLITNAFSINNPSVSLAVSNNEGVAPKMEFFKSTEDIKVGDALYDENNQMLKDKIFKVKETFNTMLTKLNNMDINKSKQNSLNIISNTMGTLKSDMRSISKISCDGDILVRSTTNGLSGTKEAAFDYTTGKFTLKPYVLASERVIEHINDLYFNIIPHTDDNEVIQKELIVIHDEFYDWLTLIGK